MELKFLVTSQFLDLLTSSTGTTSMCVFNMMLGSVGSDPAHVATKIGLPAGAYTAYGRPTSVA